MTTEEKKTKILAAISVRGWSPSELFYTEGKQLETEGKVKAGVRYSAAGGRRVYVWEAA